MQYFNQIKITKINEKKTNQAIFIFGQVMELGL